jgi:hypothetical protein
MPFRPMLLKRLQRILLHARADVMRHPRPTRPHAHHYPYVRQTRIQQPSQQIAHHHRPAKRISGGVAVPNRTSRALPIRLKIQHSAMIDIRIRPTHSPRPGIRRKIPRHILMHQLL